MTTQAVICTAACSLLLLLLLYTPCGNFWKRLLSPKTYSSSKGPRNVGFLWYDVGGQPYFQDHLRWTTRSLLKHSTVELQFHVVTNSSREYAMARDFIFKAAEEFGMEVPQVWEVNPTKFIASHREQIAHFKLLNSSPGQKFFKNINALYPFLPDVLEDVAEIIMMDTDLRFLEDIKWLFDEFDRFPPTALIGCAPELNPSFYADLAKYRRENPGTRLGGTEPKHMQGLNTGVLMLKLDGLRSDPTYRFRLDRTGSSALYDKYRFDASRPYAAGHQDFFTLVSFEHPQLFHFLGCGWNRNLCPRKFFSGVMSQLPNASAYFTCREKTRVLHGNCAAPLPEEI